MATIIDVAKMAGVSKTTVSRYLNAQSQGHMSDETQKRIKDAIEELNYTPNNAARSLKGKSTKVIGLILNDLTNSFFLQMVQGIEAELHDSGYNILMCDANLDPKKEIECLKMLEQRKIDGILIVGVNLPVEHLKSISIDVPVVLLERNSGNSKFDSVTIDNYHGAYAAIEYLIQGGYQKIAHIQGVQASMMAQERKNAYLDCLSEHGYSRRDDYIVDGNYKLEGGYEAMEFLMNIEDRPDAVFCANDTSAIGAMRFLIENGYNVPRDIAIVGYDDIPVSLLVTPPLTTVRQPVLELAKIATRVLLERIQNKNMDSNKKEEIVLKSELVIRQST